MSASHWTQFTPGAGDTGACDTAKVWLDEQATDLSDAATTVTGLLRDLDDSWTGESADAFRERLTEFETQLGDALEAI